MELNSMDGSNVIKSETERPFGRPRCRWQRSNKSVNEMR